jgi:hypothetical protein
MILLKLDQLRVFHRDLILKFVDLELILQYGLLLGLVVSDHLLIDRGLVLHDLGAGREAESRQRLVVVD